MWFVLALISSLTFGLAGFMMKASSAKQGSTDHLLWGLYFSGTLGFLIWVLLTGTWSWDFASILSGIIIGIGSAAGNLLFMKALDHGPASLTSPIVNSNVVFTVALSVIFYGEKLSLSEWIGIALLIIAIIILPIDPDEKLRIHNLHWYLLVLIATLLFFLRNGGLKITEEMHLPNAMILFISYFFGLIWFSVEIIRKKHSKLAKSAKKIGLGWGLGSGIFSFAGMQIYAIALAEGPASIVSPIFSTNSLVVAILSIWIYRERLSLLQTLSLIILFIGLICIRL
ncbi:EamA family transporter [Thermoflavimicrobium daqui]|uniref:EamA family transporter n=1 Tax=Thermoflavimicrobium daqui TaxID=2137476 RepID=A0A364K9W9_9BACL|nr:DMT family transporter [Thermoflavimicrobium daqui]RAL27083.1 EamA family transporter [Thermoflavimicrobium daqui]